MRVEFFIGWRYLFSRRNSRFISLFTFIAISGVTLGVMALIVILAVLNGFHDDLKEKILGSMPHVKVMPYNGEEITGYDSLVAAIEEIPGVSSAAPLIESEGMVVSRSDDNAAVQLRGVDPERERRITGIAENIYSGAFDFTSVRSENGVTYPAAVIGSYMAQMLRVGVGDIVTVWTPRGAKITPVGLSAIWRKFTVSGIFETGLWEVDAGLVYMSLEQAQSFFGMDNAVSHIEVRVIHMEQASLLREKVIDRLGGYPFTGTDWIVNNKNLFEALKLEKAVMFIILTLIVIVAASNIVGNLAMLVMDKNREIGILRSMGLNSRAVGMIFVFNGLIVGAVGTLLGTVSGLAVCELLDRYELISIPGDVYFISSIPVITKPGDIAMVIAASLLIALAATVYPAMRAASLPPVDAIRYE